MDIKLSIEINLNSLAGLKKIRILEECNVLILEYGNEFQLLVHEDKVVWHNLLSDTKFIGMTPDKKALWIQDGSIRVQNEEQFIRQLKNNHIEILNSTHQIDITKSYFLGKQYFIRYLSEKNAVAIFGMTKKNGSDLNKKYDMLIPCLSIWDLTSGNLLYSFKNEDAEYFEVDSLDLSENQRYIGITTTCWDDGYFMDYYLINIDHKLILNNDTLYASNSAFDISDRRCFFSNEYYIIPPLIKYNVTDNFFTVINLSTGLKKTIHLSLSNHIFDESSNYRLISIDGDNLFVSNNGRLRSFCFNTLMNWKTKEIFFRIAKPEVVNIDVTNSFILAGNIYLVEKNRLISYKIESIE